MENLTLGLMLVSSIYAVLAVSVVQACWALLVFLVCAGLHWLVLGFTFLSFSLVIVYVGAVMTLFIFAVHLLPNNKSKIAVWGFWIGLLVMALGFAPKFDLKFLQQNWQYDLGSFAHFLYDGFTLEIMAMGALLLLAIIGAVLILNPSKLTQKKIVTKPVKLKE